MKLLFDIIMITIIAAGACFWLFMLVSFISKFNIFRDYLLEINDQDTLHKIGRIDSDGKKIFKGVPFTVVHKKLTDKYKETKNIQYQLFDIVYMKYTKRSMALAMVIFLIYVIYQIVKVEVFNLSP